MNPPRAETPFIGRRPLLRRLQKLYRAGRHVLLVGPAGVGKTMLIEELARSYPLLLAPRCRCLGNMLAALEPCAGLGSDGLKLAPRVHRLVAQLPKTGRPIVLENVAHVPPRVAHLVRVLLIRQPVWLVARSTQPLDLGHVWPYLFFFQRVDVPPFSLAETRAFLAAIEFTGDRAVLLGSARRLHRMAAGHPATLAALVGELGARVYDLANAGGRRLLALHARISHVETELAHAHS